jgi:hypothetical protein
MVVIPIMNARTVTAPSIKATADIQAWTEQAAEALQSVNLSTTRQHQRGNPVRLSIPLDQNVAITSPKPILYDNGGPKALTQTQVHASYGKHALIRRDSLDRREALLKGKEGSRQRRRWENGKSI